MAETRRMAEEATRMGEEVQERTQRMGLEYQRAAKSGFEAASRSFSEANKGFQSMAAELTDFSKDGGTMSFVLGSISSAHHIWETWSKPRRSILKGRLMPTRPSGRNWVK